MNDLSLVFSHVITGAVGAGKSSVISHFRSLKQHDEWTEPRLDEMAKDPERLTSDQIRMVDEWVAKQFRLRNNVLNFNENQIGMHILDRGPLDPVAFTPKRDSISTKAKRVHSAIRGRSKTPISGAHVIVLKGDPEVLYSRATAQGKEFPIPAIAEQQDRIVDHYSSREAVTVIDTRGLSLEDVVRSVAHQMFRKSYAALDFDQKLDQIAGTNDGQISLSFGGDVDQQEGIP